MKINNRELEKIVINMLQEVEMKRKKKGMKINKNEEVEVISEYVIEGEREGKKVEEVMEGERRVIKEEEVMDGVKDIMKIIKVEEVFREGRRIVSINNKIK